MGGGDPGLGGASVNSAWSILILLVLHPHPVRHIAYVLERLRFHLCSSGHLLTRVSKVIHKEPQSNDGGKGAVMHGCIFFLQGMDN